MKPYTEDEDEEAFMKLYRGVAPEGFSFIGNFMGRRGEEGPGQFVIKCDSSGELWAIDWDYEDELPEPNWYKVKKVEMLVVSYEPEEECD